MDLSTLSALSNVRDLQTLMVLSTLMDLPA
jgi:hypothetical protein